MLVLGSEKENERVRIGKDQDIIITVVEIRGGKVRLGFDADDAIPVHREEVSLAIAEDPRRPKRERTKKRHDLLGLPLYA